MENVILFGASIGGQNFIKNNKQNYNIVAISDNNKSKQGQEIHGIQIIDPNQIKFYQFDYIIVTSMYVDSISKQLKELNIDESKIKFASKNSMKIEGLPFENEEILNCANKMILLLGSILEPIPHFFTFGTLLGIVRDGRLIPWDDDIDIAIFARDIELAKQLLLDNKDEINNISSTKIYFRKYQNDLPASISIDCYFNGNKSFNINLDCMYLEGGQIKQELNLTPAEFFSEYDLIPFEDNKIRVPKNYKEYLSYTYGDWEVIKKNTSFANNTLSFREPKLGCSASLLYK